MFLSLRICSDGLPCFCRDGSKPGHVNSRLVDADELGIRSCPSSTGCLLSVLLTSLFEHDYPSIHLCCIYHQYKFAVVPRTIADCICVSLGFSSNVCGRHYLHVPVPVPVPVYMSARPPALLFFANMDKCREFRSNCICTQSYVLQNMFVCIMVRISIYLMWLCLTCDISNLRWSFFWDRIWFWTCDFSRYFAHNLNEPITDKSRSLQTRMPFFTRTSWQSTGQAWT